MYIPSIDSLQKERIVKENSKMEIYTIVLNKCIEKIVYTNRHTDKTFVLFEIPQILIGYPTYDMRSCLIYIMRALEKKGYIVDFISPFYLYIDWGQENGDYTSIKRFPSNVEIVFEKKNKKIVKKKK